MNRSRHMSDLLGARATGSILLLVAAALWLAPACRGATVDSAWRSQPIVIDGQTGEWTGTWYSFADDRIAMSVMNDGEFLYVGLAPSNAGVQAQVMHGGITVWFDPQGGHEKGLGIHYPLGREAQPAPPESARVNRGSEPESARVNRGPDAMRHEFEARLDQLEILSNGGNDRKRMQVSEVTGIETRAGFTDEQLACELKIPLRSDPAHPFNAGAIAGQPVGIGVEIPAFSRGGHGGEHGGHHGEGGGQGGGPDAPGPPTGGGWHGRGGGGPEGGGMSHGGGGHGGHGGDHAHWSPPTPIEFWVQVKLASADAHP